MLAGISSRMWSEWRAYWSQYGFGERRMDGRFAQMIAQIANLGRGQGDTPVTARDILPDEDGDEWEDGGDGDDDLEPEAVVDEDQLIFEALAREAMGDAN